MDEIFLSKEFLIAVIIFNITLAFIIPIFFAFYKLSLPETELKGQTDSIRNIIFYLLSVAFISLFLMPFTDRIKTIKNFDLLIALLLLLATLYGTYLVLHAIFSITPLTFVKETITNVKQSITSPIRNISIVDYVKVCIFRVSNQSLTCFK